MLLVLWSAYQKMYYMSFFSLSKELLLLLCSVSDRANRFHDTAAMLRSVTEGFERLLFLCSFIPFFQKDKVPCSSPQLSNFFNRKCIERHATDPELVWKKLETTGVRQTRIRSFDPHPRPQTVFTTTRMNKGINTQGFISPTLYKAAGKACTALNNLQLQVF